MSDNAELLRAQMSQRFERELQRNHLKSKPLSRKIGAHENTLGNYQRGNIPDQWLYLSRLHHEGIDIRYLLVGTEPAMGLSSDESLLLKAYRGLSASGQAALIELGIAYAKDLEQRQPEPVPTA